MSAYIVFMREKMRDKAEYEIYSGLARASMAGHPAKPHVVYGACESLEGPPIEGCVILEFPTVEAAKAWYDGPAYREARKHRHLGCDYRAFITEGL